jgi:hypothetical protein
MGDIVSSPRIAVHDLEMGGPVGKPGDRTRNNRRLLLWLIGAFIIALAILEPALNPRRNCGGNNRVLCDVRLYLDLVDGEADDGPDQGFRVAAASPELQSELADCDHDIRPARFLVPPMFYRAPAPVPRRIIIVCDTPYENVPQPIWLPGTPRHAVGYTDGSSGLISVAASPALDLSKFRPLDELLAVSQVDQETGNPTP